MTRPALPASSPATARSRATAPATTRGSGARRVGRAAALGVAAAGLALVAGCTTQSPAQTLEPYQPADGVPFNAGSVQARDVLIVASAKGATGVLSGSLINTGTTSVTVSFAPTPAEGAAPAGTPTTITLKPREQQRITSVEIPSVAAAPGALTPLTLTTPDGAEENLVPVLLPTEYYSTLTPTSTPTPSETATPTEAPTQDPTETPTEPPAEPSATTTTTAG